MASRDFLRAAITDLLAPVLIERGFVRVEPKVFARIRGDMIDRLSFQVSRWGSRVFYLHTWINPRCSPPNDGYLVGKRYDFDDEGLVDWVADCEERAVAAVGNVRDHYIAKVEPWFQSIPDLSHFLEAYLKVPQRRRKSAEYLAMALALGRNEEYQELVKEIDERNEEQPPELVQLRAAEAAGKAAEMLIHWRSMNEEAMVGRRRARGAV